MNDALDMDLEKSKLLDRASHKRSASGSGILIPNIEDPSLHQEQDKPVLASGNSESTLKAATQSLFMANTAINCLQPLLVKATQVCRLSV